mgnify:FL=1|tara:strand:+ start:101 stop:202 length:102 start_codon:yes stop_codon:yes gene_type:complete
MTMGMFYFGIVLTLIIVAGALYAYSGNDKGSWF